MILGFYVSKGTNMEKYSRSYPETKDFHYTKHARHYHINIEWKAALILVLGTIALVAFAFHQIRPAVGQDIQTNQLP